MTNSTNRKNAPACNGGEISAALIFDQINEAVVGANKNNFIEFINPGAQRLLGYRAHELKDQPLTSIFPVLDITGAGSSPALIPVRRKDGSELWVQVSTSRFGSGDMACVISILREVLVQDQKRQQEKAAHFELQAAFDSMPDALLPTTPAI